MHEQEGHHPPQSDEGEEGGIRFERLMSQRYLAASVHFCS